MNMISDEILKNKYDELYKKLIKGDFSKVIKESKEILKKRKHQYFFNLLSFAYQKSGKIEKSINVMNEALALNPNHPNFLNNMGTCLYMLHKYSEAENPIPLEASITDFCSLLIFTRFKIRKSVREPDNCLPFKFPATRKENYLEGKDLS